MNEPQAYLNGEWIPASEAVVHVGDAGFVMGTTVAEQLRTFGGKLFRPEEHLARLLQSLQIVGVNAPLGAEQFLEVAADLVGRNHRLLDPADDLGLAIVVTPGAYAAYPPPGPDCPTVCLHTYPLPFRSWAEKYHTGQSLRTTDVVQVSPQCWPPSLKCRSRMHYHLADRKAAAEEAGARALLLDERGLVTEASTANVAVFTAAEGLISPPPEKILAGISLAVILELAEQLGIPFHRRDLTPQDVATADEVLLASTPLCLLPVTQFNGRPIGDGNPGEVFRQFLSGWNTLAGIDVTAQAERFSGRV